MSHSDRPITMSALAFLASASLLLANTSCEPAPTTPEAPSTTPAKLVRLTLKIEDPATELNLTATKQVPEGSLAFDELKKLVQVKYKELGGKPFVTGLCGVEASTESYWALSVDGKYSDAGIGEIKITRDTEIGWKLDTK